MFPTAGLKDTFERGDLSYAIYHRSGLRGQQQDALRAGGNGSYTVHLKLKVGDGGLCVTLVLQLSELTTTPIMCAQ